MFREGGSELTNKDLQLTSDKGTSEESDSQKSQKPWKPMRLIYTGEAKDVVQGGVGKSSTTQSDPGDAKKPQGQG